ncbi:RNA polymerase, sigma subunit, ECF family [Neorhodopirellula lusitana]|uniref:RNA polymerase, sigma subunit, ECF family n=1 Tax=Neorhodopirellula lusitana TaxID=445327 RepID=A0ABY1PZ97_9BACT|nr:sigma-70 family RNA polymerase sigma factor [Neorhodopirellula lusitana]SMP50296.1 RNA polymerase, sigma subunit, ECF family [Neorhodopirellula lusitana]
MSEPTASQSENFGAHSPPVDTSDPDVITRYEPYLRMLARTHMRAAYQAKLGASDIVQQAMMQAVGALGQFRGGTEAELRGWLRQILVRQICHLDRDMHRDKRDVRREQSMEQKLAQSSMRLEGLLSADQATPSQVAVVGENLSGLVTAVERLPDDQRHAIELHYLEGLKLAEVAEALGKTTGAIAGLLHRGMKQLRAELNQANSQVGFAMPPTNNAGTESPKKKDASQDG